MSGCIRTTAGVKIVCYLDSRLVFYDSDDFKSHRPAWIHDLWVDSDVLWRDLTLVSYWRICRDTDAAS